ncbi:MAG: 50S ribosomal protein L18 [Candidatus Magasanikbacteria bacterium]
MRRLINKTKNALRQVRHARVRAIVKGTASVPRLSVFRSLRGMTTQIIDDTAGKTLCYANQAEVKAKTTEGKKGKVAMGYLLGELLAQKAKAKGVTKVVFDRGGYKYHGRVQALADGARAGGLQF